MNEPTALERPSNEFLDHILGRKIGVLDDGFIRVVDYMGNESAVVQAARVSYGKGVDEENPQRDVGLLRYLMRNAHTSPFEMCEIKLHIRAPIFVIRQWIRHRTANVNEISGRYVELPREFFVPATSSLAVQSALSKQGREAESYDQLHALRIASEMADANNAAFDVYDKFVRVDELANELARTVLPLSTYTELYWKIDLHNLLHFLKLRAHSHAQAEIRAYAQEMLGITEGWVPNITRAFHDYVLSAKTFSRQEVSVLQALLEHVPANQLMRAAQAYEDDPSTGKAETRNFQQFLTDSEIL